MVEQTGWRRWVYGAKRPRTKEELVNEMNDELTHKIPGVDWNFSQYIRDNVMEALSGVKGDNSVKIFGPDLDELDELADQVQEAAADGPGRRERRHLQHQGPVEPGVPRRSGEVQEVGRQAADVNNVIQTALGGKALSTMIEGEKSFDIAVRWPLAARAARRRSSTSRWTSPTTRWC